MRRTMARWNQRCLVRTFDALADHAVERIRVRTLLRKVLGRVDNYAAYKGLAKWKAHVAQIDWAREPDMGLPNHHAN